MENKQEILYRIGAKPEPVEKIFDSLRDYLVSTLEVNNKMLATISDLERENKNLLDQLKIKDDLIGRLQESIKIPGL